MYVPSLLLANMKHSTKYEYIILEDITETIYELELL